LVQGDTLAVLEFVGDSTGWMSKRAGNPTIYRVASYVVDRAMPKRDEVRFRP
jgi:hypothetical protein